MRRFNLIFFFLVGWFLTACDTESCACVTFDLGIEVAIEDAAGNDLLDPSTEGYFGMEDINMFYEIGGKLKTYASTTGGVQSDSEGFAIRPGNDGYILDIFSNPTAGKKVVTILRIKDHPEIRLVTQVSGENGKHVKKLWYNDQLVWSSGHQTLRQVTVTLD